MNKKEIKDLIISALPDGIDSGARFIGSDAVFDSIGLVSWIIDIEEALEVAGINITIANENAMSRFRSPFINVETLTDYLYELLNNRNK